MDEKNNNYQKIFDFSDLILFIIMSILLYTDFKQYQSYKFIHPTPINFSLVQYYYIPSKKNHNNNNQPNQPNYNRDQQDRSNYNRNEIQDKERDKSFNHDQPPPNEINQNIEQTNSRLTMTEVLLSGQNFYNLPKESQEQIMQKIVQIDIREPFYAVDQSCQVPNLVKYTDEMCAASGSAFTGKLREKNVKMAHIMNFAFEVDVLEIHLNELYPVVDKIFLCECIYIHGKSGIKKPCVWNMIKDQPRFSKFKDKVVLLWLSEDELNIRSFHNEWRVEYSMENLRWKKFLKWNEKTKFFDDDDVVGFGDSDEIASISNLNLIKQCETKTIKFGIWFTRGRITEKVKTDWPVANEPFALGDPSFFTIQQAKLFPSNMNRCYIPCNYPGRTRGYALNFVLGGLHLSSYKYMPQYILKLISMTEHRETEIDEFYRIMDKIKNGENIQNIQRDFTLKKFPS